MGRHYSEAWSKTDCILHLLEYLQFIFSEFPKFFSNTAYVSLMHIYQKQLTPWMKWAGQGDLGLCMDKIITSVINDLSTLLILNKINLVFNTKENFEFEKSILICWG